MPRLLRWLAAVAAVILVLLGGAYYFTVEPAPTLKVRWREGVSPGQRAAAERQLLLVNGAVHEGRSFTYDLLDTRAKNLEAIVTHTDVEDTSDIDRTQFTLPPDIPYGQSWMWAAHRTPLLRAPGVVTAIVVVCVGILLTAGVVAWRRYRPAVFASAS